MDVQQQELEREKESAYIHGAENSRALFLYVYKEREKKKAKKESAAKKLGANILIVCLPASRLREVAALSSVCVLLVPGSRTARCTLVVRRKRVLCLARASIPAVAMATDADTPPHTLFRNIALCVCNNITHSYIYTSDTKYFSGITEKN
jgi:hypothetical protein